MLEGIPKISVLVITYNQEDIIRRTIDSLLYQKDYIYEICVSDDCSKDSTWDILQDYSAKNPGLFVLNRNDPNIGIFENVERSFEMPSGDIIYQLAGDDECGNGWFKAVVDFIKNKGLDYKNDLFCIYGDYRAIYPNGDSFIYTNKLVTKYNPLRLVIRDLASSRSTCFSKRVLDCYGKVSRGRSYYVEAAQDRQLQMFSKHNYYLPIVGNIYYARLGVSTTIDRDTKNERLMRMDYFIDVAEKSGVSINDKDQAFMKYRMAIESGAYLERISQWIKSFDIELFFPIRRIRRILFALMRRLPHKKNITDFKL
jgi:glycosyltransferase involved in cell wall biosynthesis